MAEDSTKKTYNKSAQLFPDYFATVGSRVEDIEKVISYLKSGTRINALEIGCGDGRHVTTIANVYFFAIAVYLIVKGVVRI
jgi:tRNA G46 methylase TrmB